MALRVIDEDALYAQATKLANAAERGHALAQFHIWVTGQPEPTVPAPAQDAGPIPALVGAKGAAAILGIHAPHVTRFRRDGRLEAIPVEGGNDVFARAAVEALARELATRRKMRAGA